MPPYCSVDMIPGQSQVVSVAHRAYQVSRQPETYAPSTTHLFSRLTAALQSEAPLKHVVQDLGTQLGVDGCVLMGYYPDANSVVVSRWVQGLRPQQWRIAMTVPTEPALCQHQLALSVLQHLQAGSEHWLASSQALFQSLQETDWWSEMTSQQVIPIDQAATAEGAIVLLSRQSAAVDLAPELQADLSSLGALALHQQHLQQQAHRSIEQLRYINHLKDDFLSTLSHELRTPLTSMMLAIRMLRRSDLTPERQAMYLDILEQQCSQETRLVNDLLTLRTLEAGSKSLSTATVNLNQWLRQLADTQRPQLAAASLTLHLEMPECPVEIESDTRYLAQILGELLTNARKYSEPGSDVVLRLKEASASEVLIELHNTGCGIAPEEISHIFDKFRRGRGSTQQAIPGTGTGLAIVRGLVKQLQGEITVSSEPQDQRQSWQTVFTLRLPRSGIADVR